MADVVVEDAVVLVMVLVVVAAAAQVEVVVSIAMALLDGPLPLTITTGAGSSPLDPTVIATTVMVVVVVVVMAVPIAAIIAPTAINQNGMKPIFMNLPRRIECTGGGGCGWRRQKGRKGWNGILPIIVAMAIGTVGAALALSLHFR